MKLCEARFLVDENVHPEVVRFLRDRGLDVVYAAEGELRGSSDALLLQMTVRENRVMLTHDSDFGTLSIAARHPLFVVVYLRPGHIDASFTIEVLEAVLAKSDEIQVPSLVVG